MDYIDGVPALEDINELVSETVPYSQALRAYLVGRPHADVAATATQSMANATETLLTYASALTNVGGMWNASEPSRLTCNRGGVYMVTIASSFGGSGTGSRIVLLKKNGVTFISFSPNLTVPSSELYSIPVRLAPGDYLTVSQYQSSGSAMNTHNQSYPRLAAVLI